MIVYVITANM